MNLRFHGILGTWKPCFVYLLRYYTIAHDVPDWPTCQNKNKSSLLSSMVTTGTGGGHNVHAVFPELVISYELYGYEVRDFEVDLVTKFLGS